MSWVVSGFNLSSISSMTLRTETGSRSPSQSVGTLCTQIESQVDRSRIWCPFILGSNLLSSLVNRKPGLDDLDVLLRVFPLAGKCTLQSPNPSYFHLLVVLFVNWSFIATDMKLWIGSGWEYYIEVKRWQWQVVLPRRFRVASIVSRMFDLPIKHESAISIITRPKAVGGVRPPIPLGQPSTPPAIKGFPGFHTKEIKL